MSQCAQCQAQFTCGMVDADGGRADAPCWCTELPPLIGVPLEGTCLCPNCLRERVQQVQQGKES